jgi:type VI secretion system protein VasJ
MIAPIAGANPAGADASYDPDFEAIKAEIDKLSSVDNVEPSWTRVEELGRKLLAGKSKDLRVVSWMTVARAKTTKWRGFAEALLTYEGLTRDFWDVMYPEVRRARARLNAIAWMADMANQAMQGVDVTLADADAVRTCDEALNALDSLLAEKLGDAYVGPGQLRSLMRNKLASIPEPPPEPALVEQPSAGAPEVASAPAEPVASVRSAVSGPVVTASQPQSVEDVTEAVRANGKALIAAATLLRDADPTNPVAYRLQRWGAWIDLDQAPTAQDQVTDLTWPYDEQEELNRLRDAGQWLDMVKLAEQRLAEKPLWLDVHRLAATALDQLGPTYRAAREVVGREILHLLGRLPALLTLKYSDNHPLVDPQTETWLQGESRKWGGGIGTTAAARAAAAEEEEVAARLADAQAMVGAGKVADGLGIALALADRAADGRQRFRGRLNVGKIALGGSKPELARPMLEHLLADVERHGLEAWEPGLCATLYSSLLEATRAVSRAKGETPDLTAKADQLFDKLCRLDPASAIKLAT